MKVRLCDRILCALLLAAISVPSYFAAKLFFDVRALSVEFNGLATCALFCSTFLLVAILYSRVLHWLARFQPGQCAVNELGTLAVMHQFLDILSRGFLVNTGIVPIPLRPLMYKAFGAQVGRDVMIAGIIVDPPWISLGDNLALGEGCVLTGHCIEHGRVTVARTVIEDGATIGARAFLLPGVHVGRGAVVAIGSVVAKGTVIPPGEIWGGIPARKLQSAQAPLKTTA